MALESIYNPVRSDPRLDWVSKHDTRSLAYPVRRALGAVEIEPRRWKPGPTLNQRREGACVGFGWTQELMTSPKPFFPLTIEQGNRYASSYYHECLANDEYAGEADTGTSVLAGAQTAVRRGFMPEYRWCLDDSIADLRDAVIAEGPVVIGIPWLEDMYETTSSGLVKVGGNEVGGHCLLIDEYHPGKRIPGEDYYARFEVFGWHNSWSDGYGVKGRGYIRPEELRDLLANWGEACVPMRRNKVRF